MVGFSCARAMLKCECRIMMREQLERIRSVVASQNRYIGDGWDASYDLATMQADISWFRTFSSGDQSGEFTSLDVHIIHRSHLSADT